MLFDSHTHLESSKYKGDLDQVVERIKESNISLVLNVGINLESSKKSIQLAEKYEFIYASVGIHPHDAKTATPEVLKQIKEMAKHPKVVALGEMGLDYYHNYSTPQEQQKAFRQQLQMAHETGLPVIIHDREAHEDILRIMEEEEADKLGGVFHCFSGSWEMAQKCLGMNFYISLAGPVTFANAKKPKEIAKRVPLDRLLIETDSPYLTPHPHRGKRNEPGLVKLVAGEIASLRQVSLEQVAQETKQNGIRLFDIK